jgi:hypothetical protein
MFEMDGGSVQAAGDLPLLMYLSSSVAQPVLVPQQGTKWATAAVSIKSLRTLMNTTTTTTSTECDFTIRNLNEVLFKYSGFSHSNDLDLDLCA